jgi:DnaK suppressor protein
MSKKAKAKPVKTKAVPKKPAVKAKAAATAKKSAALKTKPVRALPAAAKAKSSAQKPASALSSSAKSSAAKTAAKDAPSSKAKPRTQAIEKTQDKKLTAKAGASTIVLPPDYRPSEDEPFMSEKHRAYFRQKLQAWKEEIIRQTRETLAGLHEDSTQHADLADRATSETDRALELRARDRQRKLIAKIDAALSRIEDGTYGYCEETGEPIGLKRLDARPIATLSLEAQERHERRERVYRED